MASNKPRFGGGTEIENTLSPQPAFAMDEKKIYAADLSEEAMTSSKSLAADEDGRPVSFRMAKNFGYWDSPKLEADEKLCKNRRSEDLKNSPPNPVGENLHAVGVSVEPEENEVHVGTSTETTKPTSKLKDGDSEEKLSSVEEKIELDLHSAAQTDDALCREPNSIPELQALISVFEDLGISAPVKPYTRLNEKKSLKTENASCDVTYCKNLFLKDRKGQFYLIVAREDCVVDLKQLKVELGAHRNLSFADPSAMAEILGVKPGAVTPLALVNESARQVKMFIHESLVETPGQNTKMAFHPLVGHLQVELSCPELRRFVEKCGGELKVWGFAGQEGGTSGSHLTERGRVCYERKSSEGGKEKAKGNTRQITRQTSRQICNKNFADTHKSDTETSLKMKNEETETSSQKSCGDGDAFGEHCEKGKESLLEEKCTGKQMSPGTEKQMSPGTEKQMNPCTEKQMSPGTEKQMSPGTEKQMSPGTEKQMNPGPEKDATTLRNVEVTESQSVLVADDDQQVSVNKTTSDQKKKTAKSQAPILLSTNEREGKGKLRSYLKKSKSPQFSKDELDNIENDPHSNNISPDARCVETSFSKPDSTSGCQIKAETPTTKIAEIKQSRLSPQVEHFYNKLSVHKVSFQEIELSSSDSLAIGPAIGTRCFLLKDNGNKFFFVISHEFYELDYGRLKQALRPRKKLQRATEEEMITVLGVDASRLTPFALMNAVAENVRVFITEKILPGNIVLCMQHPYAAGHRIVLSSAQLQSLLASLEVNVGSVKEKKWTEKYSFTFSQFNGLDAKTMEGNRKPATVLGGSGETLSSTSGKSSSLDDDVTRTPRGEERICEKKGSDSTQVSYSFRAGLSTLSSAFFNTFFFGRKALSEGTSVDALNYTHNNERQNPVENCLHSNEHQNSVDYSNRTINGKITAESTTEDARTSKCASVTNKEGREVQSNVPADRIDEECPDTTHSQLGGYRSSINKQKTHLTTEDIIDHLNHFGVLFELNLPKTKYERSPSENEHDNSCSSDSENSNDANYSNSSYETRRNFEEDDESEMLEDEEDDSTESCCTSYLRDEENSSFIIVGGESDVVSRRRFRRRFQINTKLNIPAEYTGDDQGLCISPFSAFLFADSTELQRKTTLVLTTSIYIDEDTKLKFMLDQSGTAVVMTSRELERYARAMGVEVSYMP